MSTSTIHTVLAELQAGLSARSGLVGVDVFSAPMGDEAFGSLEAIEFTTIQLNENPLTMGGTRLEEYTLAGVLSCLSPGAGETTAQEVRERAMDLWGEVESYLADDTTINGLCLMAQPRMTNVDQGYSAEGRVCLLSFEISVRANKTP